MTGAGNETPRLTASVGQGTRDPDLGKVVLYQLSPAYRQAGIPATGTRGGLPA